MPAVGDFVNQLFASCCEFRSVAFFGLFELNFHGAVYFPNFIGADASRGGSALDFSGFETELCVVPGTGDTAVLNGTEGDRRVGVRTEVIEGVDDSFVTNEGDAVAFELVGTAFSFFEFG